MLSKSYSSRERKSYAKSWRLLELQSVHLFAPYVTLYNFTKKLMQEKQMSSQWACLNVLHERAVAITST